MNNFQVICIKTTLLQRTAVSAKVSVWHHMLQHSPAAFVPPEAVKGSFYSEAASQQLSVFLTDVAHSIGEEYEMMQNSHNNYRHENQYFFFLSLLSPQPGSKMIFQ